MKSVKHVFIIPQEKECEQNGAFLRIAKNAILEHSKLNVIVVVSIAVPHSNFSYIYTKINGVTKMICDPYLEFDADYCDYHEELLSLEWENGIEIDRNHSKSFGELEIGERFDQNGFLYTKKSFNTAELDYRFINLEDCIQLFSPDDSVLPLNMIPQNWLCV